uniref:Transglycosylase family protein n=1 Tax=Desulfovibrio sp. U5L TaxID=596152 RepID=I2Q566_9BACT
MEYIPVDHDPFATAPGTPSGAVMTPVDHDPFAAENASRGGVKLTPVDHDPFSEKGQTATDYGVTLRKALDRTGAAMGYGLQKIGLDETGQAVRDFYHAREATAPQQSESYKRQEATPWTEAIKSPATAVGKLAGDVLSAAPDMALATGAAMATGGLALPGVAGAVAGGAAGGAAFGLGGAERAAHEIETMPEEQLRATPAFADAYAKTDPGLPDAERLTLARKSVADTVARATMGANIGVGGVVGPFGGAAGRLAEKAMPSLAGRIASGSIEGGAFMGGMQTADNAVRQGYVDPNTSLTEGLPDAVVGGAVFGGAHSLVKGKPPQAADQSARIDTRPGGDIFDALHSAADAAEAKPAASGPAVPDFIQAAATRVGEDPAYLMRNMMAESGGKADAKASTSSAQGLFQFTDPTWRAMVNQYGRDFGLTMDGRGDPTQQATAASLFTRDNRAFLRDALGREPSDGDLYTAAFLGRGGAEKFLDGLAENAGDQAINHASPAAVRANWSIFHTKDGRPRTLQEVYDMMAAKVAPKDGEAAGASRQDVAAPTGQPTPETPAQAPESWPLRPELDALRQDMEQRAPGVQEAEGNPWDMRPPAMRIDDNLGLGTPLGRQAELDSLRQDILGRDVASKAADEVGAPVPAVAAERINSRPALPEGQTFDMVPVPADKVERLPARLADSPTMPAQPGDIRFHLNDKPAEAFQGITPEDVAHGIKGYTEAAPGAAPVRIVRTMDELPPHLLEEYRRSGSTGAIEGVYDRGTRAVWLVADNLESKSRAGEIWLHENVAHHGLRGVFGTDARFDKFLTGMAKDYGFSDHIAAEEHIARLAERMNVGEALAPRDRSLWGRFVDYVRGWLVKNGWATPKPADLDALLRDSLTRMTRGGGERGAEGSARFSARPEDRLEADAGEAAKEVAKGARREIGPMARWLGTPDYTFQKHPVAWKIYNTFRDRVSRAHEILHTALDLPDGKTVMDRWKTLPENTRALVNQIIDVADVREIRRPAVEEWMAQQNVPEAAREMYRLMRDKYDALLDERLRPYKEMLDKGVNPDIQYRDADGKLVTMSLKEAVNEMGQMRGFYAPRIRQNGDLAVMARRKLPGGDYEYARHHVDWKHQAKGLEKKLRAEGWEITGREPVQRLGESTQQAIARVGEVAKVVESAAQGMKGAPEEARKAFLESLVEELSTDIKARGFRSSAIRRTGREGRVVRGYIEDAGERFAQYAQRTSYGIAKMEAAQEAVRSMFATGPDGKMLLDPRREPRTFEMVQNYLQDQLRNPEKADRIISLGKSIATFKYLGFNAKSALVNLTTLATQVPPAMRVYGSDSKVSLLRCDHELARALPDAMAFMLGKSRKNLNPDERSFLAEIQRKDLDDPQFAREAFKTYQATAGRAWSQIMNKAMLMFGATEQFNRLSTQLAAYRVARLAGFGHQEATERALLASDRAHGVYGREAMPEAAWGTNAGARMMQLGYVYQKYAHNTLQLLADVWGKGDARAFMHLLAAPLVMGGVSTGMGALYWTAAKAIYSTLGDSRDPKEAFFAWVRRALGQDAEQYARFGALGGLGIDVSGSMDTQVRMPASLKDLAGPIGGVANDLVGDRGAAHYLATGQPGKALEKALPTGVAKPFQAMRESTEGVTSSRGYPLRDDQGGNYMPTPVETTAKAMGFRPAREARLKDMDQAAREEERSFQDRRNDIMESYRALTAAGGTDRKRLDGLVSDIAKFNAEVESFGRADVQPITQKSLESSLMRFRNASKQELGRRGMGDAPEADSIGPENFALADQMVRFREVKAKVNDLYARAEDLAQAGRMDEARQLAQRTGVVSMHDLIADIEGELRDAAALRKDAEETPRLSGAQREAARREADFRVRRALRFFETKAARWRQ